jgi:hypothetical protein
MRVTLHDMAGAGAGVLQQAVLPALLQPVETGVQVVRHQLLAQAQRMQVAAVLVFLLAQALL